jgi:hypothetical protein
MDLRPKIILTFVGVLIVFCLAGSAMVIASSRVRLP